MIVFLQTIMVDTIEQQTNILRMKMFAVYRMTETY